MINVHCKFDAELKLADLKDHPKNRNRHPEVQIDRLAKLYEYQGIRHPIIVSKRSNFIVAGHGRKQAAIKLGLETFPVVYQDFESDEQEYAFIQSDNAIALWSSLDFAGINLDIPDLGPDLDIDMLGIRNFHIDVADKFDASLEWAEMPEFKQEDKESFRHVIMHFATPEHAKKFFDHIGYPDTGKTKSLWYPPQERMDTESKRYGD
jgi:hypothetical protein